MSSYPYNNGDGLTDLDITTPIGVSDPVSDVSPAIQQIKKFLHDPAYAWLFKSVGKSGQFSARSSGTQSVATFNTATTAVALTLFNTVDFDLDAAYNSGTCVFTAPVAGIYDFTGFCQFDNAGSTAASMQIILRLMKNGANINGGSFTNVTSPPGNRWYVTTTLKVKLVAGDLISLSANNTDGVGTGATTASNAGFFGNLSFAQ